MMQTRSTCRLSHLVVAPRTASVAVMRTFPIQKLSKRGALVTVAAQKQEFTSFDDMIARSDKPLLIDFYATWCGPCTMLAPILAGVSTRLKSIQVIKIDTDKYPAIATRYQIKALPTLMLFRKGEPIDRLEGLPTEQQLVDRIVTRLSQP